MYLKSQAQLRLFIKWAVLANRLDYHTKCHAYHNNVILGNNWLDQTGELMKKTLKCEIIKKILLEVTN